MKKINACILSVSLSCSLLLSHTGLATYFPNLDESKPKNVEKSMTDQLEEVKGPVALATTIGMVMLILWKPYYRWYLDQFENRNQD